MKSLVSKIFLAALLMLSCAKKTASIETASPLDGTWSRACEADSPDQSFVSKIKFEKNELTASYKYFSDSFCAPEFLNFEIRVSGQATLGGKIASGAANEINLNSFRVFLTLKNDQFTTGANSERLFGYNNWAKDSEKEITGKSAEGGIDFTDTAKSFDIFSTTNSLLCFGLPEDGKDGSTAAKRPTKVDSDCYFRGDLNPTSSTPRNTLAALSGTWAGECEEDDGSSSRSGLNVSGATATFLTTYYADSECTSENEIADITTVSTLEVGSNTFKPAGATEINVLPSKVLLSPSAASIVAELNNENLYGFADWALNTPKDITGKNEDGSADTTPTVYTIFKIIGDSLCFGIEVNDDDAVGNSDNDDGSVPTKRHTYLDNECMKFEPDDN